MVYYLKGKEKPTINNNEKNIAARIHRTYKDKIQTIYKHKTSRSFIVFVPEPCDAV